MTSRWLGLTGLVAGVVAACTLLGLWQLGVARDHGVSTAVRAAASLPRAPLETLLTPHTSFGSELSNRPVVVTGRYAAERAFVVVDRRLGSRSGSWVVAPLVTERGTVAVLRGFVAGSPTVPKPPAGTVTIEGTLAPGESPRSGDALPAPQRRAIDLAALVNEWPGELYNAVVFASGERAAGGDVMPADGLARVPAPPLDAPVNLRNAAYAVQWWLFGLFAVWMWWKMVRAEHEGGAAVPAPREEVAA